jgi:outer membrane protein assembly factor BamD (BamD/ComL family)
MSMVKNRPFIYFIALLFVFLLPLLGDAQPYSSIELKKPSKYESRELPAEKTGSGKIAKPKKYYQNTVTHFNYYFNAQNKINDIVEKAKLAFVEDYTQLLPFYNYTLADLSKSNEQLDSVIYKCTAGVLLHDLRNSWVDNLYLLMGEAYLYKRNYDSAATVFQYLNFAFAPKDGGYDLPIGSNAGNTNGQFTIVTKENRNLWNKFSSEPPSRNDGFLWQSRTYLEQDHLSDAFALLEILKSDPNLPKRLLPQLNETLAYAYYKEGSFDSSAKHIGKALDRAITKQDRARWLYLMGQLYTKTGKDSLAVHAYLQSIKATTDPTQEVYARLAISALEAGTKANAIQENLNFLYKMAKRPLYEPYRDIIYFAIAQLEVKQNRTDLAQKALLNSVRFNDNNPAQKQASFLMLADLNYQLKKYPDAYRFYDSLQADILKENDKERVLARKPALKSITENMEIIHREDSLQKLALMPVAERDAILKAQLKKLRKEAGLKDSDSQDPSFGGSTAINNGPDQDLFGSGGSADFYFQNAGLKSRGFAEFKAKWGNRPNVDQWRRQSAIEKSYAKNNSANIQNNNSQNNQSNNPKPIDSVPELSMESLMAKLPLTTDKMSASYLAILKAELENAGLFQNNLSDFPSAIQEYRSIVTNFPDISETEKSLFNLALCYDRNNQPVQADSVRQLLKTNFAGGAFTKLLQQQGLKPAKDNATVIYEQVYDSFIAGDFKAALETKQEADKRFGKSYWTPQQLFIESIYFVKTQEDSIAINRLTELTKLFPTTPLAEKAITMIDVLKRRKEIEKYLTDLKIERPSEIADRPIDLNALTTEKKAPIVAQKMVEKQAPTLVIKPIEKATLPVKIIDSSTAIKKTIPKDTTAIVAKAPVIVTEVPAKKIVESEIKPREKLDATTLKNSPTAKKEIAPTKTNIVEVKPIEVLTKAKPTTAADQFTFDANDPQFVAIALEKVDGIFASEAKNAFNRYNKENFSTQNISIGSENITPNQQLILIGPFDGAANAVDYINKTKPLTKSRIIPWLATDKYSFVIISGHNLDLLKTNKDLGAYRQFLHGIFPDIF